MLPAPRSAIEGTPAGSCGGHSAAAVRKRFAGRIIKTQAVPAGGPPELVNSKSTPQSAVWWFRTTARWLPPTVRPPRRPARPLWFPPQYWRLRPRLSRHLATPWRLSRLRQPARAPHPGQAAAGPSYHRHFPVQSEVHFAVLFLSQMVNAHATMRVFTTPPSPRANAPQRNARNSAIEYPPNQNSPGESNPR